MMHPTFLRLFFGFVVFFVSVTGSIFYMQGRGFFDLQALVIKVEAKDSSEMLHAELKSRVQGQLQDLVGRSLWTISVRDLQERLQDNSWIKVHRIKKSWPESVVVQLEVKEIIFYLVDERGRYTAVYEDGVADTTLPFHILPSRPLARDVWFFEDRALRFEAVTLLKEIPKNGVLNHSSISDMGWTSHEGFTLRLISSDTKVLLGRENYQKKIRRVSQVLEYLSHRQQTGRVIDAAYSQKVLVRLRNGP